MESNLQPHIASISIAQKSAQFGRRNHSTGNRFAGKVSNISVGILGTRTSLYERNIIHGCGRKGKSSAGAPKAAREGACAPRQDDGTQEAELNGLGTEKLRASVAHHRDCDPATKRILYFPARDRFPIPVRW